MSKDTQTTTSGNTGDDKAKSMTQGEANKKAAKFAFLQLYNEGNDFSEDLYLDDESDELNDGEKMKMYNAYTKVLDGLASKAAIGHRKTSAYDL